jgi:hypothetical protein
MAIKTTWTEVNKIIKEEFQRVMEKKKIQSRIQQINEELAHMEEEDSTMMGDENLEEVEAGSEMKVRSHAWTGEEDGDTKWTPEFEHKGSHLLEDEELEVGEDEDLLKYLTPELQKELNAKLENNKFYKLMFEQGISQLYHPLLKDTPHIAANLANITLE